MRHPVIGKTVGCSILLAPDLAPAGRNLLDLEHEWPDGWIIASLSVFFDGIVHGEPLLHKVLLLLLTVPIPDFDLLAFHTEPPEVIPLGYEGGHCTDLRFPGRVVQAE